MEISLRELIRGLAAERRKSRAVWMTSEEGTEEKADEKAVATSCKDTGVEFRSGRTRSTTSTSESASLSRYRPDG